jgi:hypothetical protein
LRFAQRRKGNAAPNALVNYCYVVEAGHTPWRTDRTLGVERFAEQDSFDVSDQRCERLLPSQASAGA